MHFTLQPVDLKEPKQLKIAAESNHEEAVNVHGRKLHKRFEPHARALIQESQITARQLILDSNH